MADTEPKALEVQLCEAIVSELNDPKQSWLVPFEARRSWLPVYPSSALQRLVVSVVPLTLETERISRAQIQDKFGIAIDFQKAVDVKEDVPLDLQGIDDLSRTVEQVCNYWQRDDKGSYRVLNAMPDYRVMGAARDDIYDLTRLYADHTFESLIALTIQGFR